MWGVEEVKHFENAETYQEIRRKYSEDVRATYLQNFSSRHFHSKKKHDGDKKNGE
jgi:hypothetical protein